MNKHPLINKFPGLDRLKTPKRKKSSDKSLNKSVYPKASYWVMPKNSLFLYSFGNLQVRFNNDVHHFNLKGFMVS